MATFESVKLNLKLQSGMNLYYNKCKLRYLSEDLEKFLHDKKYEVSKEISLSTLFSQGIKYNNAVEGYNDDLRSIDQVINNIDVGSIKKDKQQRILNLYKGYKFILENNSINKKSIKELYHLLSDNLLEEEDLNNMGEYYRNNPVYIHYSPNMDVAPDLGMSAELVTEAMDRLIDFINDKSFEDSIIETFIKSQIAHFYFVHIHPYYDINGRTARTIAMWKLTKENADPFLIFNRGLLLDKPNYYRIIRDVAKYANVTFFLNYLISTVKAELEKEYIINQIEKNRSIKLTQQERQTIYNLLSFKNSNTIIDFSTIYNKYNDHKKPVTVFDEMITPLVDKGIIILGRETNKVINNSFKNRTFDLNFEGTDEEVAQKYYSKLL